MTCCKNRLSDRLHSSFGYAPRRIKHHIARRNGEVMDAENLNEADTLALLKLTNRLHELPGNPIVQHEYMLRKLCDISGASAGVSALLEAPPRQAANILFLVHHGLDAEQQQ